MPAFYTLAPGMPASLKQMLAEGRETLARWSEDKAGMMAAALAYYALFSLAPLVLIAVAVAGLVFGQRAAEGQLYTQLAGSVGEESARAVQRLVAHLESQRSGGILATVVGVVTLFLGASGVFSQLQDSMNIIWKAKPRTGEGALGFLRVRLVSFSMVMAIGLLLLLSLLLSAVLGAVSGYLPALVPGGVAMGQVLNAVAGLLMAAALFATIYKVLPDTPVAWRDVWLGALVTSLLFTVGKIAIGLYLGRASVASSYGAAGSLVILLLWIYYSAMLLYLGAEFTRVHGLHRGNGSSGR